MTATWALRPGAIGIPIWGKRRDDGLLTSFPVVQISLLIGGMVTSSGQFMSLI